MTFKAPSGWSSESDKLYVHTSGVRIQRMTYHEKDGWFLIPFDLDTPVVEFEPTTEGRDKAFEAFASGALKLKITKPKAAEAKTRRAKAIVPPPEENEDADEHPVAAAPAEVKEEAEEEEDDEDEDEEKEEKEEPDEGV